MNLYKVIDMFQLKVGSKLQDKLNARRQRRAQIYCEQKQILSINTEVQT